jgi:hypothetical protein
MDSFFDYIIIIFFVVSALSSLFKKKKPQTKTDYRVDLEGFPVDLIEGERSAPLPGIAPKEMPVKKTSGSKGANTTALSMEEKYTKILADRKRERLLSEELERVEIENEYVHRISKSEEILSALRNHEKYKDYYIVSEILDKPVALRDNG